MQKGYGRCKKERQNHEQHERHEQHEHACATNEIIPLPSLFLRFAFSLFAPFRFGAMALSFASLLEAVAFRIEWPFVISNLFSLGVLPICRSSIHHFIT